MYLPISSIIEIANTTITSAVMISIIIMKMSSKKKFGFWFYFIALKNRVYTSTQKHSEFPIFNVIKIEYFY